MFPETTDLPSPSPSLARVSQNVFLGLKPYPTFLKCYPQFKMNQHFNYLMGLSFVMKYSWVLLNLHFSNHVYSAKERSWLEYDQLYGMPPTARIGHGFTIAAGKVFVFGGKTMNGYPRSCTFAN